ncbi:MAG TPA: flagellar motor protein MotB, partial [bacterium]|nr:flagellar motor protein MotB [bacterium]
MRPHGGGRRGGHEEAKETPELWFISMADLMSLLFAFFVLLTSASAAPKDCNGLAKYLDDHRAQYKNFELQSSKLQCVIILPSDFLFQSGEDKLQAAALVPLRPLFQEIVQLPEHKNDLVIVEGHTDNVPIATKRFPSNWEL